MRIYQINSYTNTNPYQQKKYSVNTLPLTTSGNNKINSNYSPENIRANYAPSFQRYKKVGKAIINERANDNDIYADIKKEKIGDYISMQLNVGRNLAGFIDIDFDSAVPIKDNLLSLSTNCIPEILHLRSILGDKYSGIGTVLIKAAVRESYENGGMGNLWLVSEKCYEKGLSKYRSNENPIPFYYKTGFKSPDKNTDTYIQNCLKAKNYDKLPKSTLLILTPEARDTYLKELKENSGFRTSLFFGLK